MKFNDLKSETLNLRVSPTFKQALKEAADYEQRSMVNMLEVLLAAYCDNKGIVLTGRTSKRSGNGSKTHAGAAA